MDRSADWMEQARGDLAHARNDLSGAFYDWACFSAQQAAEKAAKAVLHRRGAEAWGHSVADLLEEVRNAHGLPAGLLDSALELDKSYISARYPDAHPAGAPRTRYTRAEAERMVAQAEEVIDFCQGLLPPAQP
jgi:HEPN domain-containing protein